MKSGSSTVSTIQHVIAIAASGCASSSWHHVIIADPTPIGYRNLRCPLIFPYISLYFCAATRRFFHKPSPCVAHKKGHCQMRVKTIDRAFQSLYGLPCWGVHYQRSLNLSINFGNPSLHIREPHKSSSKSEVVRQMAARRSVTVRGQWWLWIYCCAWRLASEAIELATGFSSLRRIASAITQLEGQQLVSVEIEPDSGATRFFFDLGCVLHCRRSERVTDDELWTLYKLNGYVLSVHGNGTFSHQRATNAEKRPQPIEHGVPPDG